MRIVWVQAGGPGISRTSGATLEKCNVIKPSHRCNTGDLAIFLAFPANKVEHRRNISGGVSYGVQGAGPRHMLAGLARVGNPLAPKILTASAVSRSMISTERGCIVADDLPRQRNLLFKIVTVRDEIVVGLADEDIQAIGGDGIAAIGRALVRSGELTLMRFAVRKAADGELEQAPLHRISILAHGSLRVEPYPTPLRIVPIA